MLLEILERDRPDFRLLVRDWLLDGRDAESSTNYEIDRLLSGIVGKLEVLRCEALKIVG